MLRKTQNVNFVPVAMAVVLWGLRHTLSDVLELPQEAIRSDPIHESKKVILPSCDVAPIVVFAKAFVSWGLRIHLVRKLVAFIFFGRAA